MDKMIFATTMIFMLSCGGNDQGKKKCINPAQINPEGVCTQHYNPVCGCNDKTYGNICEAERAGVTSWTKGECGSSNAE